MVALILFLFLWKILLVNNGDPDQTPHYVASDLGLHCLPMVILRVPGKNGLTNFFYYGWNSSCVGNIAGNQSKIL